MNTSEYKRNYCAYCRYGFYSKSDKAIWHDNFRVKADFMYCYYPISIFEKKIKDIFNESCKTINLQTIAKCRLESLYSVSTEVEL